MPCLTITYADTVGAVLARDRLAARAARLRVLLAVLDLRASAGASPPRLRRAIADVRDELARVEATLAAAEEAR